MPMLNPLRKFVKAVLPNAFLQKVRPLGHGLESLFFHYYYGRPSDKLIVIGITGTKGKTSTTHIIYQVLNNLSEKCGIVSTAVIDDGSGEQLNPFRMTQMSGAITHKLLAKMVKAGCKYASVEVSSEGLAQNRHRGINFDIAVFTNLTQDHLDAHGSFEKYKEAKSVLFKALRKSPITSKKLQINLKIQKTIIANLDSEYGLYYLNFKADRHITYAIANQTANFIATDVQTNPRGSNYKVLGIEHQLNLPGKFNVYNALASVAVAFSLGYQDEKIGLAISKIGPIPGRMEILQTEPFVVLVDYAHEKASMTALYDTVKDWIKQNGKIIQVFGATGGVRDKSRRTDLGALAGKFVDIAIITDEDPFDEDPKSIIHDIADAAVGQGKVIGKNLFRNPNRGEAIQKALSMAESGDLVLITGKGAEQKIARANGTYEDWDDRIVTRELLSKLETDNLNRKIDSENTIKMIL